MARVVSPTTHSLPTGTIERTGDRTALVAVLLVWLGMLVWAFGVVRAFAPPFPISDEINLYQLVPPLGRFSWAALWKLHNEHRIPLPRLLHYLPYALTDDLRTAEYLQTLLLGAVALGMIALARRLRGRASWTDAVFPLLWLHVGNWANLLSGFQIALTLPTALVCGLLAGIAVSPGLARAGRATLLGLCLVALPLCGAVGLVQVPALGAWLAWLGWSGIKSPDREERTGGGILLAAVAACAAVCLLYLQRFSGPHWYPHTHESAAILKLALGALSLGLGPAGGTWWPASAGFVTLVLLATVLLLASRIQSEKGELRRRLGLLASLGGIGGLVLSIGIGRAHAGWEQGFLPRYVTLATPALCCAHIAWTLYGSRQSRALLTGSLAIVACASLPVNARIGMRNGRDLRARVERFEALVARGATALELTQSFTEEFPNHVFEGSRQILMALAVRGRPPFDHGGAPTQAAFDYLSFARLPSKVASDQPSGTRWVDGRPVFLVHAGTEIRLDLLAGETGVRGAFGIFYERPDEGNTKAIRVLVEVVPREGARRVLLDRVLDPSFAESDRGSQAFAFDVEREVPGELVLSTRSVHGEPTPKSWSYWSDVEIR